MREALRQVASVQQALPSGVTSLHPAVYLIETLGVPLGFHFQNYFHRLYSADLALVIPALSDESHAAAPGPDPLDADAHRVLDSVARLAARPSPADRARWLEALATLHWMGNVHSWNPEASLAQLRRSRPDLAAIGTEAVAALVEIGAWGRTR